MKALLDYPGSACSLMLVVYFSKSPTVRGCLVSYTQVRHEGTCSLQLMLISPRNSGWTAFFLFPINTWILLVSLNTLILYKHPLDKKPHSNYFPDKASYEDGALRGQWALMMIWLQKYFKKPLSLQSLTSLYKKHWACNSFLYSITGIK